MKYYVDYFDFFLGGIANRMAVRNRELLLKYDILCIDPNHDIFIFTVTETLLEDSNRILIKYDDFWKNGIFKIALSKKYRNARVYVDDRLKILNNNGEQNFELDIYNTQIVQLFLNDYLEGKLKLKGKNTYVEFRTSDADMNNRTLFIKRVTDLDKMYGALGEYLDCNTFNALVDDLVERGHDKSQIFQRGYILHDMFLKYPSLCKSRSFMYNLFDQNYNDAMAISVDATRLSTLKHRMNATVLEQFILEMAPSMHKKLNLMRPHDVYTLINNRSWRLFVEEINELYVYLWKVKKVHGNCNIYQYFIERINFHTYTHKFLIEIMDRIINLVSIPEPFWRIYYEQFKYEYEQWWDNRFRQTNYIIWLAAEILRKRCYMNQIIDDIIRGE